MFAIICDAKSEDGYALGVRDLALVDRNIRKDMWWTSDDVTAIMKFTSKASAAKKASTLKYNSPHVVSYSFARRIIEDQHLSLMHDEANRESELGWDAHKGAF